MINYIIRRMGYMMVTLVIIVILSYLIVELPPGSYVEFEIAPPAPAGRECGPRPDQSAGNPLWSGSTRCMCRFWKWISGFVQRRFWRVVPIPPAGAQI